MKGLFITIYGINNIGKTTHAKLLTERLKKTGRDAVYVKYPVYDLEPTGPMLHKLLRSHTQKISEEELQIWFTLNRCQFQTQILKWKKQGKIIVAEDYVGTGLAWGWTKGASLPWLESLNKFLVQEDVSILLEGARAMHKKEEGHIHETNDDLVETCRKKFLALAKKYRWRRIELASGKSESAERIWKFIKTVL